MPSNKLIPLACVALALCGLSVWQFGARKVAAQNAPDAPAPLKAPRANQTACIAGRVFDARTKAPIAGAKVSWEFFDGNFDATTDAKGNYRIEDVTPGGAIDESYAYAVTAEGYSTRANYAGYEATKVSVPADGLRFDFAMLRRGKVSGQVNDSAGRPIASAHVYVYSETGNNGELVATDTNGRWKVDNLNVPFPQGTVTLGVEAFDPRFSQVESKAELRAGEATKITQSLPARAVISGRLTRNGKPLAGAYAQVNSEEGMGFFNGDPNYGLPLPNAITDKNGRYRLLVSAPKTFELSLDENDSVFQKITVKTQPGQTITVNRDLKPFPYGSIRGRVTDLSGKPLAGGDIELWNRDTSETEPVAKTDKAGRFFIAKVAPRDDYNVTFALPNSQYRSNGRSGKLRVRSYQTTNVTIRIDTIKPKLEVPDAPRVVSGTVKVPYQVSDNRGVWLVSLGLDGGNLNDGSKNLSVSFDDDKLPRNANGSIEWNTRRSPNGRHQLHIETADRAGNVTRREWFVWIQNKRAQTAK